MSRETLTSANAGASVALTRAATNKHKKDWVPWSLGLGAQVDVSSGFRSARRRNDCWSSISLDRDDVVTRLSRNNRHPLEFVLRRFHKKGVLNA